MRPAATQEPARYTAYSEGNDSDDVVIQTLVGDFVENGNNHSRPTYRKVAADAGKPPPEVFLYYWDARDGPAFEGWWFGKSVGGNEVWSHNVSKAVKPPPAGWKIPFAGEVCTTFHVKSVQEQKAAAAKAAAEAMKAKATEQLAGVTGEASAAMESATAALEQAKGILGDGTALTADSLKEAEDLLTAQVQNITKAVKAAEPMQVTAGAALPQLKATIQKLRASMVAVNQEMQKIRIAKPKVIAKQKEAEAATAEKGAMQEALLDAVDKTNAAEDLVEKTALTYETVEAAGDDMGEAQRCVEATQELAQQSQLKIKEALALIGRKMVSVKNFATEIVREQGNTELNNLRAKIRTANQKLTPLLNVRQDFQQMGAAKKIVAEVNDRLAPAELDVDRATETAEPLLSAGHVTPSPAIMKHAEVAINMASDKLSAAIQYLQIKLKPATGLIKRELEKVEKRAQAAEKRVMDLKNAHRSFHEREMSSNLINEVGAKMRTVNEAVQKCQEVMGPYLMGVEGSGAEAAESMAASEEAMKVANKATSNARILISMKLVEAKRFTKEAGDEAMRTLQEHQKELETAMVKMNELKSAMADRKQVMQRAEAMIRVEAIECIAKDVQESGELINEPEKLKEMQAEEIREAGDIVKSGYQDSLKMVQEAQRLITARQIDAKNLNDEQQSAELAQLQVRLRDAQQTLAQWKTLPPGVEKHVALKKLIDEALGKVTAGEEKVDQAVMAIDALGEEKPEEDAEAPKPKGAGKGGPVAAADRLANEASMAMKNVLRFLEMQTKQKKIPEEDLAKLQERVRSGQERLSVAQGSMTEKADTLVSRGILQEVEAQVKAAEEAAGQVVEAYAPLMAETPEEDEEKLKEINAAIKKTDMAASKAIAGSKTIMNVKRIAAKRLCAAVATACLAELDALQARVEAAADKKDGPKRTITDKKYAQAQQEVSMQWARTEEMVMGATQLAEAFAKAGDEASDEVVDKTLKGQQEAQTVLTAMRTTLNDHLKQMKAGESSIHAEFSQLLVKAGALQTDLDKHKKALNEREAKQVKARLLKEAAEKFGGLDGKLEKMQAAANPLVGEEKEDFTGAMYLSKVIEALKARCSKTSKTNEQLFDEIRGEDSGLTEAKFLAFVKDLAELKAQEGAGLGEAQIKAAYARLDSIGGGSVAARQFLEQFRSRYVCAVVVAMTDIAAIAGSKVLRKLEQHEEVEGLGEPAKDAGSGIMRVKVRADKDKAEGYVAVASNTGTVYLEPFSAYEACLRQIEATMKDASEAIEHTMTYLKEKADDLSKKGNLGPLGEAKAELMKLRMRASKAQSSQTQLKKKVADAQKGQAEKLEAERRRKAEAAEKALADHMVEEATKLTEEAVAEADKAAAAAESMAAAEVKHGSGNPLEAMTEAARRLALAEQGVSKALSKIMQDNMGEIRKVEKGPFVEARRLMFRLKVKLDPMEKKCKKAAAALQAAQAKVSEKAQEAISASLRGSLQAEGALSSDALFAKLSGGNTHIAVKALRTFLESLEGELKLQASQLDLGLHQYSAGVTRLGLLAMLQEYNKCVKDVALTSAFEVRSSSTIRKLEKGEIVEILGGRGKDEAVGLERVRCRALKDAAEGWVTSRGNQGTAFVEPTGKPYQFINEVKDQCTLQKECASGSEKVCDLQAGDVVELLEGPRKEPPIEIARVRGKAKSDGKMGWTTMKDPNHSTPNLEPTKLLMCKASIALTDGFDVKDCTSLRKLEVGEMLEPLEPAKEDAESGVTRVHIKALKDGKDGWATTKGNAGTVFVAECLHTHACRRSVQLEGSFASGSKLIRQIEEGEIFEVLEGPSTETKQGSMRSRARNLRTGSEGWFTTGPHVVRWCPRHTCVKSVALRETAGVASATVRQLEEGEVVQALDPPVATGTEGKLTLHVRTDKDGVMGFADVRASAKEVFLKPVDEA